MAYARSYFSFRGTGATIACRFLVLSLPLPYRSRKRHSGGPVRAVQRQAHLLQSRPIDNNMASEALSLMHMVVHPFHLNNMCQFPPGLHSAVAPRFVFRTCRPLICSFPDNPDRSNKYFREFLIRRSYVPSPPDSFKTRSWLQEITPRRPFSHVSASGKSRRCTSSSTSVNSLRSDRWQRDYLQRTQSGQVSAMRVSASKSIQAKAHESSQERAPP